MPLRDHESDPTAEPTDGEPPPLWIPLHPPSAGQDIPAPPNQDPDSVALRAPGPGDVGGKGASLCRLAAAGLPVPPGGVLTTAFFAPWVRRIRDSEAWGAFVDSVRSHPSSAPAWTAACERLEARCTDLALSPAQADAVEGLLRGALYTDGGPPADLRLAVRSSSSDEDQDVSSFAGGYRSLLGIPVEDLEAAIRSCFASCFNVRVAAYRLERGLDPLQLGGFAVVLQRQIDSLAAGVAFSLDPVTNDHDEAVIDAGRGLGESVVAGLASPDQFVVDKVARRILSRRAGGGGTSIWLADGGGTLERPEPPASTPVLDTPQVLELTDLVCRIENLYGRPVDIEWAVADDGLHILQARPITTYVPLPPEMMTPPGHRRRLYADIALSGGLTINAPISPLGLDWMRVSIHYLLEAVVGPTEPAPRLEDRLWFFTGGRMYQNLSNMLRFASPRMMAKGAAESDALMAETLGAIDPERYRSPRRPPWLRWGLLLKVPRALGSIAGPTAGFLKAVLAPQRTSRELHDRAAAFEAEIAATDPHRPPGELARDLGERLQPKILSISMPALAAGLTAMKLIGKIVGRSERRKELAEQLTLGVEGNLVAEMGMVLHELATLAGPEACADPEALARRIDGRRMPRAFLDSWDAFRERFGCRGPHEMDLASPRYGDDPALAAHQIAALSQAGDARDDPRATHAGLVARRRRAFRTLEGELPWYRRLVLRRLHTLVEHFAGWRDTPKHHNLMLHQVLRSGALETGRRWVEAGRLDRADDVFGLNLADLAEAADDPGLDLRRRRRERVAFLRRLELQVHNFPGVIDSRGRILRPPPRAEAPGELRGTPVSPGRVTGPVKILSRPDEKPIEPGDVLVAYTTDPGWTPLFVHAGAVVLEVGGVLQHGAVVAREFGKPCVVGIDRITARLEDGETVEVDGAAGVLRRPQATKTVGDRPEAGPARP
ncbi:MAG: PEP/pyruvate-binding domain-containing protein [Acidobacteriota bacterium]